MDELGNKANNATNELGKLVHIPDDILNYDDSGIDADENAKIYARWFFETHIKWLEGVCYRYSKRYPQLSPEEYLSVAWDRLPLILQKFRADSNYQVKGFVSSQLKFYFLRARGRDYVRWQDDIELLTELREYSYDIEHGKIDDTLASVDFPERNKIIEAIYSLEVDSKYRIIMQLFFIAGMNYRDIAKAAGCSLGTVANYMRLGLKAVYKQNREYLDERNSENRYQKSKMNGKQHKATSESGIDVGITQQASEACEGLHRELQERIAEYWRTVMEKT